MADYVYTTDIVLNSFKKIMADKEVWRINRGRINEYSLYILYIYIRHLASTRQTEIDSNFKEIFHPGKGDTQFYSSITSSIVHVFNNNNNNISKLCVVMQLVNEECLLKGDLWPAYWSRMGFLHSSEGRASA